MTLTWVLRYRWLETSFHDITHDAYKCKFLHNICMQRNDVMVRSLDFLLQCH